MSGFFASQHKDLWFPDGSVILRTNWHLFRVHKSILARESSVFNDMFAFPANGEQPDDSDDADEYEGLPVVPLIGDKDEAVAHLLRLIYKPNYSKENEAFMGTSYCVELFKLSRKYNFAGVEEALTRELKAAFPSELGAFVCEESRGVRFNMHLRGNVLSFLPVVQEAQLSKTMPALFYCCSQYSISRILSANLPPELKELLLVGREKFKFRLSQAFATRIEHFHLGIASCATFPRCRVAARLACFNEACQSQTLSVSSDGGEFFTMEEPTPSINLCATCARALKDLIDVTRAEVWKHLPEIFHLSVPSA